MHLGSQSFSSHRLPRHPAWQTQALSSHLKFKLLNVNLTVGGTSIRENIDELTKNPHIVIGTPGRVLDMITKKALDTRNLKVFILDEADEMLTMGFKDDLEKK